MAPFSIRKHAPSWPPSKDSYRQLGDSDDVQLTLTPDIASAGSQQTIGGTSPSPFKSTFMHSEIKWWDGWRGGAKIAFSGAILVLVINTVLVISMYLGFSHMDGMSMIYIGSCTTSQRINTAVHLAVNVLSTALLAASNYCMQILCAPTRKDVDKAHSKGTWLDIGVSSLRNLRILRKQKVALWWLLALSSIPLHLFYNSVFFTAIATNEYNVLYATDEFVNGAVYDKQAFPDTQWLNVTNLQSRAKSFQKLDNAACINAYALDFVNDRKDVIAVIRSNASSSSSLQKTAKNVIPPGAYISNYNAFAWICDDATTLAKTGSNNNTLCSKISGILASSANDQWRSGGFDITYCLSEPFEPDCHVHFAPQIMAPVLFFNIMKALVIAYVAFFYKDKPLVTLGDAIDSFSTNPDPTTQGMCLATHEIVEKYWTRGYTAQPMQYDSQRRRWFQAASWKQWSTFSFVFGLAAIALVTCIILGVQHSEPKTMATAWSMGIGTVRTQNLITGLQLTSLGTNGVFISAIIANLPQTIFSFIYILYNNVFTTMVLSNEWDRFSIKNGAGRVLRVSDPRGDQKSTYFLQIQYRYAFIMLITSGLLHWLVSQSVFLANISVIPRDGVRPQQDEITTCAYSVQAMIFIVFLGIFMLLWLGGNGVRKFSGGMPFVGSNSAAISATCHTGLGLRCERETMVLKRLRWGVTDFGNKSTPKQGSLNWDTPPTSLSDYQSSRTGYFGESMYNINDGASIDAPIGHCTFSDERVGKPVPGRLYA